MVSAITGALVRSGLKDCKDIDAFDMRVTEAAHNVIEGDKTFKGVWNETWTFKVCGQMIDVGMTFIPDANGGGTTFTTRYRLELTAEHVKAANAGVGEGELAMIIEEAVQWARNPT